MFAGIRVHEGAERAAVDHEPGDEGTELRRRKNVHLEHSDRVRTDWLLPDVIAAKFRDYWVWYRQVRCIYRTGTVLSDR